MGTRHLTCVVLDGDLKIAQFGRFDGYPHAAGLTVLDFLTNDTQDYFREHVRGLRWTNPDENETIAAKWPDVADEHTHLLGARILHEVNSRPVEPLVNSVDFGYNGHLCEWAYVIDLDRQVLDVYSGDPYTIPTEGLWAAGPADKNFEHWHGGAHRVKTYPLDDLPTVEQLQADVDQWDNTTGY